jgi:hypothetical protein
MVDPDEGDAAGQEMGGILREEEESQDRGEASGEGRADARPGQAGESEAPGSGTPDLPDSDAATRRRGRPMEASVVRRLQKPLIRCPQSMFW